MPEYERYMISLVGIIIKDEKCLILKDNKYGRWVLPGGRSDVGETGEMALKRELKEEINLDSFTNLGVVDYDLWYTEKSNKPMSAVANLIECEIGDDFELTVEHSEAKWVTLKESEQCDFIWPNAKRMIRKGFEYKKMLEKCNE